MKIFHVVSRRQSRRDDELVLFFSLKLSNYYLAEGATDSVSVSGVRSVSWTDRTTISY